MSMTVLQACADAIARALATIDDEAMADPAALLNRLGIDPLPEVAGATSFASAWAAARSAARQVAVRRIELEEALADTDALAARAAGSSLVVAMTAVSVALEHVGATVVALAATALGLTPAQRTELGGLGGDLPGRMLGEALVNFLDTSYQRLALVLRLVGVIEDLHIAPRPPDSLVIEHVQARLRSDRLLMIVADPLGLLRNVYRWGAEDFDGLALYRAIASVAERIGFSALILMPPGVPAGVDLVGVALHTDPGSTPPGVTVSLRQANAISFTNVEPFQDWDLSAAIEIATPIDIDLAITPPLAVRLVTSSVAANVNVKLRAERHTAAVPLVLAGAPRSSRIEVERVAAETELLAVWTDNASPATLTPLARVTVRARVVVQGDNAFLAAVVGDRGLDVTVDLAAIWTSSGLRFEGSTGLEVELPLARGLVDALRLTLDITGGAVEVAMSAVVSGAIGPVKVSLVGFGLAGTLAFVDTGGNLGPVDLDGGVTPPTEVGLAIDAGVTNGGGFLQYESERYTGSLALDVAGLALSACGVLATGAHGYSLAAIISTRFSPMQLGMGFTLEGVGGLIGIHRRVDVDALRAALRGPGIGDIFFATDPIGQAARLTGELGRYFPAAEGRYVFGPAVKIGWGTPTMVTGTLAVLLELPSPVRIVIVGAVHAALPTQDHAVIDLHIDVAGEIDFGEKRIAIDAALRESTIAGFPITGDLAFRMRWGDAPSFALAIGGFHSQFRAPPDFPALRRIQIPIGSGDDPRLDIQGFLALTSNTAQVGAQAELYASAGPLNIRGSLGFETLIVFSPFSLQVDVWAGVKLRRGNSTLAGVHFDGRISGPGPWRIDGKATLSLWFVDLSVGVHVTFGSGHPVELPTRAIWPLLLAEVQRPASWSGELAAGMSAVATATPSGEAAVVRIDPGATLTLRQKVVPLDRRVTRFAQGRPDGANEFRVSGVVVGSHSAGFDAVSDWFAPAQFEELSDADKLSRPGFERMTAGVTAGAQIRAGAPLTKVLEYETVIWAEGKRQGGAPYRPSYDAQVAGTAVSSMAQAPVRRRGSAAYAPPAGTPPRFVLEEETYVIASVSSLQARLDLGGPVTRGQAELALRAHLASTPGDAGALQLVPAHEAAA